VLSTSATYWKSKGKTFIALIEDVPEWPQWM